MKNKIFILIQVVILIITILVILIIKNVKNRETRDTFSESIENIVLEDYIEILKDGTLKNQSEQLKENKEIDGLVISNVRITGKDKETVIIMDIKNNSKQIKGNGKKTLVMLDKEKNEIGKIEVNLSELKVNESITLEIKTEMNFINTYDFTIIDKSIIEY